jgi:hypothetical protein
MRKGSAFPHLIGLRFADFRAVLLQPGLHRTSIIALLRTTSAADKKP